MHTYKYLDNALCSHGGGNLHKTSGVGAKDVVALTSVLLGGPGSGSVWINIDIMMCRGIYIYLLCICRFLYWTRIFCFIYSVFIVNTYIYEHVYYICACKCILVAYIHVSIYTDIHKSSQMKRKTYGWAPWCFQVVCQPLHGSTQGPVSFVTSQARLYQHHQLFLQYRHVST